MADRVVLLLTFDLSVPWPTGAAVVGAEGWGDRHGGVGPLTLHPGPEEAGQWGLHTGLGGHLLTAVW